jgi:hypothetical protein
MANKGSCKAESCDKEVVGKGYCQRHYRQWRQGGLPKARYKTCREEGCRKPQVAAARCADHQKKKVAAAEGAAAAPAAAAPEGGAPEAAAPAES